VNAKPQPWLYHGSPIQGLRILLPNTSGKRGQLYASPIAAFAAIFAARLGKDFTCGSGMLGRRPFICERFSGALSRRYDGRPGSIYVVTSERFVPDASRGDREFVTYHPVTSVRECCFSDMLSLLLLCESAGRLRIFRYPSRPACIPRDDADLLAQAQRMNSAAPGTGSAALAEYHPLLLDALGAIAEPSARASRYQMRPVWRPPGYAPGGEVT
jgi:hypothetical protein